jgi:hypothetical protein
MVKVECAYETDISVFLRSPDVNMLYQDGSAHGSGLPKLLSVLCSAVKADMAALMLCF